MEFVINTSDTLAINLSIAYNASEKEKFNQDVYLSFFILCIKLSDGSYSLYYYSLYYKTTTPSYYKSISTTYAQNSLTILTSTKAITSSEPTTATKNNIAGTSPYIY